MINFGSVREDSIVSIPFVTNDGEGGVIAPSDAFEAADVTIYRDGSATQKTSTNGLTMTSPFDSIVGLHQLDIDTNNNTGDTDFWRNGSSYAIVLNPDETVDSKTVVAVLATFTLDSDAADESTGSSIKAHTDRGFYDEDATIIIPFVTRNSDGLCTPDSVAIATYKGGSATEKTTLNGITSTIDFDSVTGKHLLVIDTSNDTGDSGFWVADAEYHVDIITTTPSALYNHPDIIDITGVSFRLGKPLTQADVIKINGVSSSAVQLAVSTERMISGTIDNTEFTPTTTQFEVDDITEATANHWVGRSMIFSSGGLLNQAAFISASSLQSGRTRFTVVGATGSAMTEAPANNDTFLII